MNKIHGSIDGINNPSWFLSKIFNESRLSRGVFLSNKIMLRKLFSKWNIEILLALNKKYFFFSSVYVPQGHCEVFILSNLFFVLIGVANHELFFVFWQKSMCTRPGVIDLGIRCTNYQSNYLYINWLILTLIKVVYFVNNKLAIVLVFSSIY